MTREPGAAEMAWGSSGGRRALLIVIAVLVGVALVRIRLAGVPLERDEGEYAYAGQLILDGVPPYQLAYNMKFPGIYYAYAAVMAIFGESPAGIRLGLLLVNAATTLLLFAIGRSLFGDLGGACAGVAFAILSLDLRVMGVFAHATHFVLFPVLAGLALLLWRAGRHGPLTWFISGTLFGTGVLVKQHAIAFLPAGALVLLLDVWDAGARGPRPHPRSMRVLGALAIFAAGAALPFAAVCLLLASQGVLGRFWFWTIDYAHVYVSEVPLARAPARFVRQFALLCRASWPLWLAGGAGLAALVFARWPARTRITLAALGAAGFLSVLPGFYFREHYFILLLPAVALLAGLAVAAARALIPWRTGRLAAAALFALAACVPLWAERRELFAKSSEQVSRALYGVNPFVEAPEIARVIEERTAETDRIAVLGSEPEIYFLANRRSATGYIYTYALLELQPYAARMQEEMIGEIERARPMYLVFVQIRLSWLPRPESDLRILDWAARYARDCFELEGIVDVDPAGGTRFAWDHELAGFSPRTGNLIFVHRARGDGPCSAGP